MKIYVHENHYSNIYGNFIHNNKNLKQNVANRRMIKTIRFFEAIIRNQKNKKWYYINIDESQNYTEQDTNEHILFDSIYNSVTAKKEDYI